jgi:hypothetical protein
LTTKKELEGVKSVQNLESKNTNFETPSPSNPENDLTY